MRKFKVLSIAACVTLCLTSCSSSSHTTPQPARVDATDQSSGASTDSSLHETPVAQKPRGDVFDRCVRESDVAACQRSLGEGARGDERELAAQRVLCEAGDDGACRRLGELFDVGGRFASAGQSRQMYARGCAPSVKVASAQCVRLMEMLRSGQGGSRDLEGAWTLGVRLCEAEVWRACARVGEMVEYGEVNDDVRDATSMAYYERAAREGDAEGLWRLGERTLWGARQDRALAREYFERACEGGSARGCAQVGVMYQFGLGVERDFARAANEYERACGMKDVTSCVALGHLHETGLVETLDGEAAALVLYDEGCLAGGMTACLNLGFMYEHGRGVTRDMERAQTLYVQACRGGEEGGCHRLTQGE